MQGFADKYSAKFSRLTGELPKDMFSKEVEDLLALQGKLKKSYGKVLFHKKESIKVETEPEEISDNTNMIPKYICINGMFSQNQVNYIVKKVEEDLTLLETIGIIENPKYKDSSKDSKKLIKK